MRELIDCGQRWAFPEDGPPHFAETTIIYKENDRLFVAHSKTRFRFDDRPDLNDLNGTEILVDLIWPTYDERFTIAADAQGFFLKRPRIGEVAVTDPKTVQGRVLSEAIVCEEIKKKPHPNLVEYRGCLVEDGKIKGLVLAEYRETLYERIKRPFELSKVLDDINRGIKHLHSIGFVHGDLSPANIMFDTDDNAVIIDFDSARAKGHKFSNSHKSGTHGYTTKATSAQEENDYYSIARLEEVMREV